MFEFTQKEIGEKLVNVLMEQAKLDVRLEERFKGLNARMADCQQSVGRVDGYVTDTRSDVSRAQAGMLGMRRDIDNMRSNMSGMQLEIDRVLAALKDHRKNVDEQIAALTALLDGDGRNGAG